MRTRMISKNRLGSWGQNDERDGTRGWPRLVVSQLFYFGAREKGEGGVAFPALLREEACSP